MNSEEDVQTVTQAFATCKQAFATRKTYDLKFRKEQLQNLLKGMDEMMHEIDFAAKQDLHYTHFTNYTQSFGVVKCQVGHVLKNFEKWSKTRNIDTPLLMSPAHSYLKPEPRGVILVIGSWNYPLFTTLSPLANAIAAGNCVIIKPSEVSSASCHVIKTLITKYLDNECFQVVEGGPKIAHECTIQPLDLIIFTGSTDKGKLVAKAAADNLTPCVLELGGKSPTIVDEDANITNAALRITQGKWTNCGQTCVGVDYLFAHAKIKDKLLNEIKKCILDFYGPDQKGSHAYSRLITQDFTKRMKSLLDDNHQGTVYFGGEVDVEHKYVQPTIIENPKPDSIIMQEEIFGPILPVYEYTDINDVVNFINLRNKPLVLYYYGKKNKNLVNEFTSSGAYSINESLFHVIHMYMPFGGVQKSGYGYWNGKFGFDQCSHIKPVMDKMPINCWPFSCRYPPYDTLKKQIMSYLFLHGDFTQFQGFLVMLLIFYFIWYAKLRRLIPLNKLLSIFFPTPKKHYPRYL